jgi:hypothetical protein
MNDFIAGPASGAREGGTGLGGGGAPPTVLLAAMGAAVLIAVTLVGFLLGSGGGEPQSPGGLGVDGPRAGATTGDEQRVLLTVEVDGGGSGRVLIDPRGVTCSETCENAFDAGTRVSLSPDAAGDSRFEGWSEACSGRGACSIVMNRSRSVTATFESAPSAPQCEDGRDNDRDGLVDEADPGCDADATEAPDDRAAPAPAPRSASDCRDGRDNDGDGLVDAAQDPDCATGGTEGAAQTTSECRDGRDNDGDGLVDRPGDPGCDADGTEAGPR